jgi:serine O-acetyltransferase
MQLVGITRSELVDYLGRQLGNFFPDRHSAAISPLIERDIDEALDRLSPCVRLCRLWPKDGFHYLHSNQNAVFLYFLANTIWKNRADVATCDRLYYLNKVLNGLECFYAIALPDIFCICHSPGIVLAQASYGNYLVLYQNSTVGRVHADQRPILEEGVVLYPNTAVIGKCHLRAGTLVAQGQSIIDGETPGKCVVFNNAGTLIFKAPKFDALQYFFRLEEK